jgi:hypothetical protein
LTLFIYSSSFLKKFGSCTIMFPASIGIVARIKNLIVRSKVVIIFMDNAALGIVEFY